MSCTRCSDRQPAIRDQLDWYLVVLHDLLGHDKAEAYVGGPIDLGSGVRPVITTVHPSARYL